MLRANLQLTQGAFELAADLELSGGWLGVFGPSGSGKSTLLACLSGLLKPQGGELWLDDRCLFHAARRIFVPPERRGIGHVFQDPALFPHLSVEQNLRYGARGEVGEIAELLDLGPLLARRPDTLSGGEQKRVALGRALLSQPKMLLLDEPLANLDEPRKQKVLPYLLRLRRLKLPMVYVSHSLAEVAALSDRVLGLEEGRVRALGSPSEVLPEQPAARAEGLENLLEVEVRGHEPERGITRAAWGDLLLALPCAPERPPGEVYRVACRGCDLTLAPTATSASARNHLPGVVRALVPWPDRTVVRLDVDGRTLVADLTAEAVSELALAPGRAVDVQLKATSIRWLP